MKNEAMTKFVSPEYKSRCVAWALETMGGKKATPERVIAAAKKFYDYVYEDK